MVTLNTEPFKYDPEMDRDANFREWLFQNSDEREVWGEERLSEAEAIEIFDKLFPKTVDQS